MTPLLLPQMGGQAKPLPLFEMASVLVPGDLSVIAMRIPDPICSTLHGSRAETEPELHPAFAEIVSD